MANKRGNFIEEHIEKAVLAVAVAGFAVILFMFVIRSPDVFKYDGKNLSSGQLDKYINEQAEKIKARMNEDAVSKLTYEPNATKFLAKMDSAVNIGTSMSWLVPSLAEARIDKKYQIPQMGEVNEVSVEHIRAAAYVPKGSITEDNYKKAESYEPNDIDLVTVQANFNAGAMADSFQECFAGKEIPEEWRDTSLARPVFAAVRLQRQCMISDGLWGQWEDVPRLKIDPKREQFRKVIEDTNGMSRGEILVQQLKMSDQRIQASLLQPEPYQIASAEDDWLPPALHKRYLADLREKEAKERRDAITAEREKTKAEREKASQQARTSKGPGGPAGGGAGPGGGGGDDYLSRMYGDAMSRGQPGSTKKPPAKTVDRRQDTTTSDTKKVAKQNSEPTISDDYEKVLIGAKEISKIRESMVFWAHDDTVEPGNSYRYRIQIGVFNPVVGTGQESAEDAGYDSNAILWSKCSDVTEPVTIPQRIYFFPVNVQETAKAVDVQVSKYVLGYWHSEQFTLVKRGDVIGKPAEVKTEPNEKENKVTLPESIDYTTGAVLVDLEAVNDWGGGKNLSPRHYFDMLYSFDGTNIARIAAKLMNWPEELRAKYTEIKAQEKKSKLAFRAWSNTSVLNSRRMLQNMKQKGPGPADRGVEGQPGMDEQYLMMYQQGMRQQPPGQ